MKNKTIKQDRKKEKEFWDNISNKTREKILSSTKKELLDKIILAEHWWEELIGKVKGKKILDIGCGDTHFSAYWQLTGNDSYESDFSLATIENNKILHEKLGLKQNFYVTSSEKIESKNNFFDIVHMRWVIHHIPPELQDASMQEIKRVLKKRGKLIIYESNYGYPIRWLIQCPSLRSKYNFLRNYAVKINWLDSEEKALTNKGYIDLLKRNGFNIKKIAYSKGFFSYPIHSLVRNVKIRDFIFKFDKVISYMIPNFFKQDIKIIAQK